MLSSLRLNYNEKVQVFHDIILLKNDHKSQVKLIYSILTALAVAELNYILFDLPVALLMIFSLIIHELGHYIYAKAYCAKPSYPLFIPIPFFLIGITHILDIHDKYFSKISLAGIFLGLIYSFILFLYNSLFMFYSPLFILPAGLMSFLFNYFGSDGKKYKKHKYKTKEF